MLQTQTGLPGVGKSVFATPRDIYYTHPVSPEFAPFPVVLDGSKNYNAANAPYTFIAWAGTFIGRETANSLWAPSIIGLTNAALGGGQTTLSTDTGTAAYLNNRVGASGTFNLTGPNVPGSAGGVVRVRLITYSAINLSTGAITITADSMAAVSAVNQVNSIPFVDSTGSGTFTITVEGITTAAITYSSTAATLVTNINNALNSAFGTSAIVASGASLAAMILTFSGTGYSGRPVGTVQATVLTGSTGYTINGSGTVGTPSTCAVTTAGVTAVAADEGEFISGSMIQPTDGSQNFLSICAELFGTKTTDFTNINTVNAPIAGGAYIGGILNSGMLVNYPTDSALRTYIKTQIRANGCPTAIFSDDWGV